MHEFSNHPVEQQPRQQLRMPSKTPETDAGLSVSTLPKTDAGLSVLMLPQPTACPRRLQRCCLFGRPAAFRPHHAKAAPF